VLKTYFPLFFVRGIPGGKKAMPPKLKPIKPYKFRVIVCDDQGNQVNDDVHYPEQILLMMPGMVKDLMLKQVKKGKEGK